MKLLHDCVRDVMLYVEDNLNQYDTIETNQIQNSLSKYSIEDINYTCEKLNEAGYLVSKKYIDGTVFIQSMSYNGHMFLDSIRDNKIWKETKSKISKFTSVSLPIIQQVATQILTSKLGI